MKAFIIVFLFLGWVSLDDETVRLKHYNLEKNLALSGYDPISYFLGKPQKGSANFQYIYNGINYNFVNKANLAVFKANPLQYEPAYGGWCAFAMGGGEKVEVDPQTFKIVEGRLYLFYNFYFNNTLKKWNENEAELKKEADRNWSQILSR